MKTVCAFAPATIANFNVGFDILGLALSNIGDKVEVSYNNTRENRITEIINGPSLPFESEKNCCTVVISKMQKHLNLDSGVDVRIIKGFASSSGLGSSSASSAAAAFAFNEIAGRPMKREELVFFAAEGERAACGTAHLDNVAPAILGGLVLIQNKKLIKLPLPSGLYVVSFFPRIRINTSDSRSVLHNMVPIYVLSEQLANMGAFITSLYKGDLEMFSGSLEDLVVEPTRKLLIPMYDEMKVAAIDRNALAFGISGSGPSVFAVARNGSDAREICEGLQEVYSGSGIKSDSYIEPLDNNEGARLAEFTS